MDDDRPCFKNISIEPVYRQGWQYKKSVFLLSGQWGFTLPTPLVVRPPNTEHLEALANQ